ncbi:MULTISPECIES: hypothetical protein [Moorena]|uniref:Uncharacterized protein n=1 Tax=Moorena producens 3L TaxID=489825 RepID=F4XUJ2_9CYAN|nr:MULTISPECIES: hypothetical protein [Moorena]EGJ31817.1 hypothetical protein LYNGBM3L_33070 [Moorena producens 3L]NEP66584.1 hypothetical protein [Moorena sp. SIO3A5]OLT63830.1 hypothetical protein BI334_01235 [Moorena producens 3L]
MLYKQLFELSILHDYYRDKVCPDLSVEPTPECSRVLRGHRLIVKNKVNGIVVIAPVDSEHKPWVELAEDLRFTFILKIKNQDFLDFTDIEWKPVDNVSYLFSNERNTKIGVSNLEIIPPQLCYIKVPRVQTIFGIVDIYNNSSMSKDLNQGSDYKITFNAKKQPWYYYLVTDQLTNGDEFLIEDKDPTRKPEIKFTRSTSADAKETDPIFSALNQQFPESQKYLFKSESEIACQEAGRQNIQLLIKKKNELGDPSVWIDHLPNPPNHNGIQVINALKYL